jgi:hypothetical protein
MNGDAYMLFITMSRWIGLRQPLDQAIGIEVG